VKIDTNQKNNESYQAIFRWRLDRFKHP